MDTTSQELRPNKRKLQDAIQSLDDAVGARLDRPSPPKRQNTIKSLYSTLSKYGIRAKETEASSQSPPTSSPDLSKAPRLAAILSRAGTKTRKVLPFARRPTTRATSEYRPSSTPSFLARLETYKLSTYSNKPPEIDAVAAAICGWTNEGKDRLQCGLCGAAWVVAGREKMSREAASALVRKQQSQLVDNHKVGCPWKTRQCDPDVYRIQLSSPAAMAKDIKSRASQLTPLLENVEIKHPLTVNQVHSLAKIIASVNPDEFAFSLEAALEAPSGEDVRPISPEPPISAILTALFGWSIAPPAQVQQRAALQLRTPSLSRANSVAPAGPSTPRRPSTLAREQSHTPTPRSPSLSSPSHALARVNSRLLQTPRATPAPEQQPEMLYCRLCHRRLGLWAFGTSSMSPASSIAVPPAPRQVDVLKEHRPYCPYVARSAVVPTFLVAQGQVLPNTSATSLASTAAVTPATLSVPVEGWRAVLLVVLRHRMGQRHWEHLLTEVTRRAEGQPSPPERDQDGEMPADADVVDAMVVEVKRKGGRELLSYVKGLLG